MQIVNAPSLLPVRNDWLARHQEETIDPSLPIVDAHHHLWDRQTGRYLFDELQQDTESGHNIVSTIYVQCRSMMSASASEALRPVGEVQFAAGIAAMFDAGAYGTTRACEAIIGGADLQLGNDVAVVLEKMQAVSGGRLRGIRNALASHEDPRIRSNSVTPPGDLMRRPQFLDGVRTLGRYGLSLDVWLYHTQLADLYELAVQVPEVTIIIDHFGGPIGIGPYAGRTQEVHQTWRADLQRLAALPNTRMKLGGAGLSVFGWDFHTRETPPSSIELAEALRPLFDTCVDLFGADRCMFESNFPVDKGMYSYHVIWNAFKRLAQHAAPDERDALFSRTAISTYKLTPA